MRITRQRLKEIIMEEMNTLNIDDNTDEEEGNAPSNKEGMDEIDEGLEMITPENIQLAANALAQMTTNFAPAVMTAIGSMSFIEAVKYLAGEQKTAEKDTSSEPSQAIDEEESGTLGELIKQAIQEQLDDITR